MSAVNVRESQSWFSILQSSDLTQTALMAIGPGDASGPKENEHAASEQVIYVVEGELEAEIGEHLFTMHAGDSTIVRRNVPHRFTNRTAKTALTFNVYSPPAY